MNCFVYLYDVIEDVYFWDERVFYDFVDMDWYIGFCEENDFRIERIVDKQSNVVYFDALPEGTIVCMMPSKN